MLNDTHTPLRAQCQSPYFVATALSKIRHASLFVPNPAGYARAGMAAIGGGASVVPYWTHALQDLVITSLPHWVLRAVLLPMHKGIRKAVLKKEAALAAKGADAGAKDADADAPAASRGRKKTA